MNFISANFPLHLIALFYLLDFIDDFIILFYFLIIKNIILLWLKSTNISVFNYLFGVGTKQVIFSE